MAPSVATGRARPMLVALLLDGALVVAEVVGGLLAHSSALLANAGHDLADAVAILLALIAGQLALRSPTASRSFGYHRATILTALGNLALLLIVTALIAAQAVQRILHPVAVHGSLVAVIAAVGLVVNGAAALILLGSSRELNIRTTILHLAGDAVASLGVLGVGLVVALTGRYRILDPIVSLAIAFLIAVQGAHLGRESLEILLESSPADLDLDSLNAAVTAVPGVAELHDLHCWSLSSDLRALSAHIVVLGHPSLEEAQALGDSIKAKLAADFQIAHATLELECESCVEPDELACAIEPTRTS